MRRSLNDLAGYTVRASDGDIGTVYEFYFDDQGWTIRYLVVDTGRWLSGRKVLVSPAAFDKPDWESRTFPVNLTKEQVRNSPSIDTDKPVSRQHETELHGYYGWPIYWGNNSAFSGFQASPLLIMETVDEEEAPAEEPESDTHLRSTAQVTGNHIEATNGEIGHVEDFMVDEETWAIRYLLVDTRNWLPGKKVLVSPRWIKKVSWAESKVIVDLTCDAIKNSPEFDPLKPVTLDYEGELHDYYGRPLD
jgi:sporulation protein YlmC with PRC-barrel domain